MKKTILFAAAGLLMAACSSDNGTVTIKLPADYNGSTLVVSHVTIDNAVNATRQEDLNVVYDTLQVSGGVAKMKLDPAGAARYDITPPPTARLDPEFYAEPGDKLVVTIRDFDPLDYDVQGSALMDGITAFNAATNPMLQEYYVLVNSGDNVTADQVKDIMDRYDAAVKKFVADNPASPAVPFAIMNLSGDDFKAVYDNMTPQARESILMPYADLYNAQVVEMQQAQAAEAERQAEIASGRVDAPGFTLPDLAGKKVSLSDFRGKWVVLDFWGSWCGWCVKGFPALKEAYDKYGSKIVVIGIDCNETEAQWRAGVEKYKLPWINLYNGDDGALYEAYGIEGFPTKAIINPEGKLVDLTTGEDPEFFDRLAELINAGSLRASLH